MKNKTLAIFGIGAYVLSVLSSAENLEGNSIAPVFLIVISGVATIAFIVMATVRLWKKAKNVSIILASSSIILFILTTIQVLTLPQYGSPVIVLMNITKAIHFIALIWAIIKLFQIKSIETANSNLVQPK